MKGKKEYDVISQRNTLINRMKKNVHRDWDLYLLLIPGVIWFLMFCYKPMVGLRMAFYDYNIFRGYEGSEFVGLANFREFVTGPDFLRTVKNTFNIALWQILICFPVPIILAIAITEMKNKFVSKLTQTATFLPYFISGHLHPRFGIRTVYHFTHIYPNKETALLQILLPGRKHIRMLFEHTFSRYL